MSYLDSRFHSFLSLFLLCFICFISCKVHIEKPSTPETETENFSESNPIKIEIQQTTNIVPLNQSITISCNIEPQKDDISFQWYYCSNKQKENAQKITGATSISYQTTVFDNKEIRYYYCVAQNNGEEIISNVISVACTGLPVVYIKTENNTPIVSKEEWLENATISIYDSNNPEWCFDEVLTNIRGRGNTTWELPKKPYALKLYKKQKILGMPSHKRWVLIANYLDNSFIKNEMAFYLSKIFELDYTVRGEFVDLVLNGEYQGLYWLGEAIKEDENRVNINNGSKNMTDDEDKDYLIEMDVHFDEPVKFYSQICHLPYMIKNDDYMINNNNELTVGGELRLNRLKEKITNLEQLLYPDYIEGKDLNSCIPPDETYSQIIDVDSWAKFWIINEIMSNNEIIHPKSCYFIFDSTSNIIKAGPVWDFDWAALGEFESCTTKESLYYNALFKSPSFCNRTKEIFNYYYASINFDSQIATLEEKIFIAAEYDSNLWGVNHNPLDTNYANFSEHISHLKDFLQKKLTVVQTEILNIR